MPEIHTNDTNGPKFSDFAQSQEPFTYDHVPILGPEVTDATHASLLPKQGGIPGYRYLQCPTQHLRAAQDGRLDIGEVQPQRWQEVADTQVYTIKTPVGSIDCKLLVSGKAIRGASYGSNQRVVYVHPEIFSTTGLDPKTGLPSAPSDPSIATPKADKEK